MNAFPSLDTPCLLLEREVLERNAARFLSIAGRLGVSLRPHLKTSKSVDVADILTGGDRRRPVTVSTLAEAEYFASAGFADILYAVGIEPGKFDRVARIVAAGRTHLTLITDCPEVAMAAVAYTDANRVTMEFLIEIDCGDGRGGVGPEDDTLTVVAGILDAGRGTRMRGVMTHAGHSYSTNDPVRIAAIAADERDAAVRAARRLQGAGLPVEVVSVGSTPTAAFAESLAGVTEVRAGVYAFFDLDQFGRGVCAWNDLALSVLATVIGHNRTAGIVLVDAGGLALSKDLGARHFLPDSGYGYVCDATTLDRHGKLAVNGVNQEHGKISVDDPAWYGRLPVGSRVRIVPNHACFTAAAYPEYHVLEKGRVADRWRRHNGW